MRIAFFDYGALVMELVAFFFNVILPEITHVTVIQRIIGYGMEGA
jgi:hypothetical protein